MVRSNHEYNYFGNVLEYDYFPSYLSTHTQKVLILEYKYEYMSTITPSLGNIRAIPYWRAQTAKN